MMYNQVKRQLMHVRIRKWIEEPSALLLSILMQYMFIVLTELMLSFVDVEFVMTAGYV
jgi:hypothetical protein